MIQIGGYKLTVEASLSPVKPSSESYFPRANIPEQGASSRTVEALPYIPASIQTPQKKGIGGLTILVIILILAVAVAGALKRWNR